MASDEMVEIVSVKASLWWGLLVRLFLAGDGRYWRFALLLTTAAALVLFSLFWPGVTR